MKSFIKSDFQSGYNEFELNEIPDLQNVLASSNVILFESIIMRKLLSHWPRTNEKRRFWTK